MWYCCHKNITWNPTLKSCMKKIHVCCFQEGKKKSTWSPHDIVTIRVSNHIYVRITFWAYTHPTPFHFANYFLTTWTRCCMERWRAPPKVTLMESKLRLIAFVHKKMLNVYSFSSSRKHYETMRTPFSPICSRTFWCSLLILWIGKSIFWEHHGTCPISSVVGLKFKLAISHYCENLQNLIHY
jgi:hypothetical protein